MNQKLIFTNLVGGAIDALVDELGAKDVFVLTDTNTSQFVMPLLVNDSCCCCQLVVAPQSLRGYK